MKKNNNNIELDINKYKDYSDEELLKEFYNQIDNEVKNGTLEINGIINLKKTIYPLLDDVGRDKLDKILSPIIEKLHG